MAATNAELPGEVPGQFPTSPGEADQHDYIKNTGPFKSGGAGTTTSSQHQTGIAPKIDPNAQDKKGASIEDIEAHYKRERALSGSVTSVGAGAGFPVPKHDSSQIATDSKGRPLTRDQQPSQSTGDDIGRDVGGGAVKEVETHYARDAAAAGAVTAVGAGAGYAAMESQTKQAETLPTEGEFDAYERAGKGVVATEPELEKKFATYDLNDPQPHQTEEMKEQIRKIEAEKVATGAVVEPPKEKKGLLQKLGLKKGDSKSESTSSSTPASTEGARRLSASLPPDEEHITIMPAGGNQDGPTLVVKEHPDDK